MRMPGSICSKSSENCASRFRVQPTPRINKPPPVNRDYNYNRDPNTQALQRRSFMNHVSPLVSIEPEEVRDSRGRQLTRNHKPEP